MKKRGVFLAPALLWKRILAFVIDILIIELIIAAPFRSHLKNIVPGTSYSEVMNFIMSNPQVSYKLSMIMGIIATLGILYFTILEFKTQQTIGKMIMKIFTVSQKKQPRFWQYLLSNLTFLPFFPFAILWIVDPIYIIFTKNNQRFMERISHVHTVQAYKLK